MAETDPLDLPDDFDRLLRQELSIEPSPAFAARVRAEAAARPRTIWAGWLLPLAGGAALAVAVFVWMPLLDEPGATLPPAVPVSPVVASSMPAQVEPPTTAPPDGLVIRPRPVRPRLPGQALPAAPASSVIVDQSQRAALTMLVGMIGQGRLTADAFAQTTPQSMQAIADQMMPITIVPVTVSTITPGGVLHNDTQHK
ncbi:MAG: hypothetical protein ABIS06_08925 [Vicinamibacterales bacterium]